MSPKASRPRESPRRVERCDSSVTDARVVFHERTTTTTTIVGIERLSQRKIDR